MNELEQALKGNNNDLDTYLESNSTNQIRTDINELINRGFDVAAFKENLIRVIENS